MTYSTKYKDSGDIDNMLLNRVMFAEKNNLIYQSSSENLLPKANIVKGQLFYLIDKMLKITGN